jgi:anti-sigma factor RsiW
MTITCREVIARLADYVDAALDMLTRARVSAHLWMCAECRAYLATYQRTIELIRRGERLEMPAEARHRVTRELLERLRRGS